jgi:hypothetical protein
MSAESSKLYPGNYDQIFDNALRALQICGFNIKAADKRSAQISASASWSFMSYGERLEVNFYTMHNGIQVQMKSTPYTWDWGKSKSNVGNFFATLDQYHRDSSFSDGYGSDSYSQGSWPEYQPRQKVGLDQYFASEPSPTTPAILAVANGFVAIIAALFYMQLSFLFGSCVLIFAFLLFIGAALIATKNYKSGAVLCAIGGAITIPIGILGLIAASKAWGYSKWKK